MATILTESALTVRVIVTIAYLVHHGVTAKQNGCVIHAVIQLDVSVLVIQLDSVIIADNTVHPA